MIDTYGSTSWYSQYPLAKLDRGTIANQGTETASATIGIASECAAKSKYKEKITYLPDSHQELNSTAYPQDNCEHTTMTRSSKDKKSGRSGRGGRSSSGRTTRTTRSGGNTKKGADELKTAPADPPADPKQTSTPPSDNLPPDTSPAIKYYLRKGKGTRTPTTKAQKEEIIRELPKATPEVFTQVMQQATPADALDFARAVPPLETTKRTTSSNTAAEHTPG